MYPGVVQKILTTPIAGLDKYQEMMGHLMADRPPLKVYVNVASE
jgi:hypothetical protein